VPLDEFEEIKLLKQTADTKVSIAKHGPTAREVVIKAYNKEMVNASNMIERIFAERDVLRLVSGIQIQD